MRFCPNCNSAVYDDRAELCPECGKPMNQNVCPSCGRRLQPGQKCPHCSDCRAHGERYTVRNQSPEQTVSGGLSMWAYMGLILLAMVPVIGLIFMIVWACGVEPIPASLLNRPRLTPWLMASLSAKPKLPPMMDCGWNA